MLIKQVFVVFFFSGNVLITPCISVCFSSFQFDIELSAELPQIQSRENNGCFSLADRDMEFRTSETFGRLSHDSSSGELFIIVEFKGVTDPKYKLHLIACFMKIDAFQGKLQTIITSSKTGAKKNMLLISKMITLW